MIRETFRGKRRTDFMVGSEIEKTPAFSMRTLFVQGYKSFEEIREVCLEHNIEHVYLGANRSFAIGHNWEFLIAELIQAGFIVTLDYLTEYHPYLVVTLSTKIWNNDKFIPMITIDISNLCGLSKNLTLKIDDTDFTSPGIWCVNYKDVANPDKFTSWDEYSSDEIIK